MDGAVYMKLFFSYGKTFEKLPDEDAGQLIKAMLHYAETGEAIPPESPMADIAFDFAKDQIDRDRKAFTDGGKGGRPKTEKPPFGETKTPLPENENPPYENQKPLKNKDKRLKDKEEYIETTTTNAGTCAREETPFGPVDIDPLIVKVQRELLGLTDTHYDLLRQYRGTLGDDLVSFAIDQAVGNGIRKWAYVETILCRYETDGIRTVAEAKAAEEKRRNQPKGRDAPKTVTAQRFQQREYSDAELDSEVSPLFAEALKKVSGG